MMTGLKIAHWLGVIMVLAGLGIYGLTQWTEQIQGILLVSSLIGLGLVMMSPFPIVMFIQWAKAQESDQA
ncbi:MULTISPECIES: hypothetical protein [Shewanella]|uniref:Uncharacterized protein n=2 Tax=Shewanella marisflavi TaxID=260364 RepID=A0AAC9TYF8_9GAMM|nr:MULTISPECIES: hypothetical protein [Shewanella]ASJ95744.1 hypothetical protein CFF01_03575 [Shewanella marisflavi]QDF74307.1 hypothetical protein FGA12_03500 [Shewanella marisflavi]